MTIEFKSKFKDRCEDRECSHYRQPCVDRGYGYPVCPGQKWRHERFPGTEDLPMNPIFIEGD